jgi:phosphopantothenoylcysteine decarboxylase/phosphopantothenate--cysteine ligase
MRILITAGPTREPLDPVRYLSNRSTGVNGFALARAARGRGHDVTLILGPVEAQPPVGVDVYGVETAREMLAAVLDFLPDTDVVICAAAVTDYRPVETLTRKLKRGELDALELVENPDIAAEVGRRRGSRPLVVFALETDEGLAHARAKLDRKNAMLCVLNGPEAIGADTGNFTLVRRDGGVRELGEIPKRELASALLDELGL